MSTTVTSPIRRPDDRAALGQFVPDGDTNAIEAAAAIRAAARVLERLRARGTDSRGLSPGALDMLIRLGGSEDGTSIKDLARSAGVSSRNVTGLVDTLERAGLVVRVPDPHDRRSVRARITAAGRTWLDEFRRPTQRAMAVLQVVTGVEMISELYGHPVAPDHGGGRSRGVRALIPAPRTATN